MTKNKELEFIRKAIAIACHPEYLHGLNIDSKINVLARKPATLARVLLVLGSGKYGGAMNHFYFDPMFPYCGKILRSYSDRSGTKTLCQWDLTKDLDDQEPETILSISKLLGYNNDTITY